MELLKKKVLPLLLVFIFVTGFFLSPIGLSGSGNLELNIASAQGATAGCFNFTSIDPKACAAWLANSFLTISGYFTGFGGMALNYSVDITILKMGDFVNSTKGIQTAWVVLRDLANIGLIFGLLAIGISTILQISGYGMRELLARLIIVALLINFSLFATKAIVDVGNAVAVMAYKQLTYRDSAGCGNSPVCLSDKFMEALKLPTIYDVQGARAVSGVDNGTNNPLEWQKILLAGVFGSLILMVAGFVFLAGALLLVTRFVVLIFLMITAPVAWAAAILPNTRGLFSSWWKSLLKEVIFAPAYLILLLATLWIAEDNAFRTATGAINGSYAKALLSADTSSFALFIHFAIIMGFMIASLIIARQIGSYGSGAVTSYGQKLAKNIGGYARRGAGAATFGLAGGALRNTVGRAAYNASQDENGLKKRVAAGGVGGLVAKAQLGAVRYGAKATYDARTIPVIKKLDLGTPVKSYESARKQQEEDYASYAQGLGKKNAAEYAKNELQKRTFFSTLFTRTAARQKVAEKILGPIDAKNKEKQREKEIKKTLRDLRDELKQTEAALSPLTSGIQVDRPKEKELKQQKDELSEKIDTLEGELKEIK